jgi:hypothetical protein
MTQSLRQVYGAGKALGSFALSITVFLQVSMATPPMQLQASEVAGGMPAENTGAALRWCLWCDLAADVPLSRSRMGAHSRHSSG